MGISNSAPPPPPPLLYQSGGLRFLYTNLDEFDRNEPQIVRFAFFDRSLTPFACDVENSAPEYSCTSSNPTSISIV